MRKIKLYIATSLDGRIATADGSVEWLNTIPESNSDNYRYTDFYNSVDTTLIGYNTYTQIAEFGIEFPYIDKTNYVFTKQTDLKEKPHVTFVSGDIVAFIEKLKSHQGGDIWLVGGAKLNTTLLRADLIDEIQVCIMPVILGDGIPLFYSIPEQLLKLKNTEIFDNGAVMLTYTK